MYSLLKDRVFLFGRVGFSANFLVPPCYFQYMPMDGDQAARQV
jgi:hypothetical protein